MEQIRAFIAIELPRDIKRTLSDIQSRLKSGSLTPVKWVEPQNLHLTLKFLGNTDAGKTDAILKAVTDGIGGARPFTVIIGGPGVFPNPRRPQVVWTGLTGDIQLLARLQQGIDSALAPLGFKAETRPFRPHLTIGRVRDSASPAEREDLGRLINTVAAAGGHAFAVDAVHLIRSRLTREGPVYTVLGSVPLR
ncbi:MAG: RNA 2',3'-cyclic phosphodiesterase [Dehalococcoidales bacterium]|nr:RNA 2',3'-cyclic phosphodiesterase [Dehalococcoidales bacterium]